MKKLKYFNKRIKIMDVWDIGSIKLGVVSFTLFIITIWSTAMTWVHSVNPWWFFTAFVVFAIKPWRRLFMK